MEKIRHSFYILIMSLSLAGLSLLNPQLSHAALIDPLFKFSTIETEHFVIHFHKETDEIALMAASTAEGIHEKLTDVFQWSPVEKTQIVLIDNVDFANGMAMVLPYNAIYVYAVPPLPDMTTGEYRDWLETVLLHEYAHILTMDPVSGFSSITRSLFGKTLPGHDPLSALLFFATAPPNVFMPKWWTEGIATWAETEFTSAGRGRSSFIEMILRMAVEEDGIPRVDQLNGEVPYWPDGKIPYIYGMLLEKYIAGTYGRETVGKLNIAHSGRFPFFISAPAERYTGLNYSELYRDMVKELKTEQYKKIESLRSEPLTGLEEIPVKGERLTNPRISPGGRYLALNRRDPHYHEEIVIIDTETLQEIATIRRERSDHNLAWSPDGRTLYFAQGSMKNSYNLYQDIFSYDLADSSVKRLTEGLRAKDIDISPDGKYTVFVKVKAGSQNIAVMENESGDVEVITNLQNAVLSGPRWSPDGISIVFSGHHRSGETSIELLNIKDRTIETLLKDDHFNRYPAWSPDGKAIIFSSDRTGVYNLFAFSLDDKKTYQVTHILGGAFQADVSGDIGKIVFSSYNSKGFFIAEMPYEPSKWRSSSSPVIQASWNNRAGKQGGDVREKVEKADPGETLEIKRYCPLQTLRPRFWLPTLSFDNEGPVFGAFTAGQDVLGYHSYSLQGGYGSAGREYFNFSYVYDRWLPTFFLGGYSHPVYYSKFFDDDASYYEQRSGASVGLGIPLFSSLKSRLNMKVRYNYEKVGHLTDTEGRRVEGLEVYEGRRDNVFIGFGYSDTVKYPYSISREHGRNISLSYRRFIKVQGSGLDRDEYALNYEEFMGLKWHHVLYFNLKGAASDGELIAQQAFRIGGIPSDENKYSVRGFASGLRIGKYVMRTRLEYRFPLKYIFRGWNTKPFFWDRLHAAAFADAGNVWGGDKGFDLSDFSAGTGVEARLDMVIGYRFRITPALGVARGITDDGQTQVYLTIYSGF